MAVYTTLGANRRQIYLYLFQSMLRDFKNEGPGRCHFLPLPNPQHKHSYLQEVALCRH